MTDTTICGGSHASNFTGGHGQEVGHNPFSSPFIGGYGAMTVSGGENGATLFGGAHNSPAYQGAFGNSTLTGGWSSTRLVHGSTGTSGDLYGFLSKQSRGLSEQLPYHHASDPKLTVAINDFVGGTDMTRLHDGTTIAISDLDHHQ